ncbi:hypothetical protein D9M68_104070 [compost metagenome]
MKILCFASSVDTFPLIAFINFDYFLKASKFDAALSSLFWTASKRLFTRDKKIEIRHHPDYHDDDIKFRSTDDIGPHAGNFTCLPWRVTAPEPCYGKDSAA